MPVPPAQQILNGVGASARPANLALQGQSVRLVHVDQLSIRAPEGLTRVLQEMAVVQHQALNVAAANPLASSMLIRNISSITGNIVVNHMLARPYLGWIVTRQRGAFVQVYEPPQPAGMNPAKQIQLHCNASGVLFDLLVY